MTPKTVQPRILILGNPQPIHQYPQGPMPAQHLEVSTTVLMLRPDFDNQTENDLALSTPNDQILTDISRILPDEHRHHSVGIRELADLWPRHCAGGAPAWVDGDPEFAKTVAAYYGCQLGQPTNLLVNGGRDAIHQQILTTATQPAAFNYIGLSADTSTPVATDTYLSAGTGEIHTSGGGLIRAIATFAHTTGTNTSTLTKTFTANGSDSLAVTIAKIGIFNYLTWTGSPSGTQIMCFETLLSGTATLSVSGDNVTITETVTAG